jgi:hypothetical protein
MPIGYRLKRLVVTKPAVKTPLEIFQLKVKKPRLKKRPQPKKLKVP